MAFELPDLPYAHDALSEFGMSKETLEFHHDLHHKAYVDNGNKLIEGIEEKQSKHDCNEGKNIISKTGFSGTIVMNGPNKEEPVRRNHSSRPKHSLD